MRYLGVTPFKTLFNFDAINITLGLNYLRVSPDHGPASDIIKKNQANYLSLYNRKRMYHPVYHQRVILFYQ